MSKVERAIIMAAGIGERMQPITNTVPKPLITVNGTRMIDTVIDALHNNDINEIYIVVGHLKEQFYVLKEKYDNLVFIDNPYYKKRTADFRKQSTVRYENDGMTGHSRRLDVIGNAVARSSPQAAAVIHRAAE